MMIKYFDKDGVQQSTEIPVLQETQQVAKLTHRVYYDSDYHGLVLEKKTDEDIFTLCRQLAESDVYVAQARAYNVKLPKIKGNETLEQWLNKCEKERKKWKVPADVIYGRELNG
ncbi:MAG TPA: hypothetical protein DD791_13620 [Syntrophomonas sp.]|nr:hypothetical protein [Syntrophomonas sp.]